MLFILYFKRKEEVMAKKKLLTLDNLYNFYLNQNKTCTFSAKESGYQVSVQIPTKFEISDKVEKIITKNGLNLLSILASESTSLSIA